MSSEDSRNMYEAVAKEKDMPIFALMIADYFTAPVIHNVDLSGYNGQAGNVIDVTVTDDVAVASVTVKISDEQGNVIESGLSTENTDGSSRWYYSVQNTITGLVNVEVVAKDYLGGVTVKTVTKSF